MSKGINREVDMAVRLIIASIMFVISLTDYKLPMNTGLETLLIISLMLGIMIKISLDMKMTEKNIKISSIIQIIDSIIFGLLMYSINSTMIDTRTITIIDLLIMILSIMALIVGHKTSNNS